MNIESECQSMEDLLWCTRWWVSMIVMRTFWRDRFGPVLADPVLVLAGAGTLAWQRHWIPQAVVHCCSVQADDWPAELSSVEPGTCCSSL